MKINEYIKELSKTIPYNKMHYFFKKKVNINMYNILKENTLFLGKQASLGERLFCIINDIKTKSICPTCNKRYLKFEWFEKGYLKYCSYKCSANNIKTINNRKKTTLKKYGVTNISKIKEIKDKKIQTTLKNYGVSFPSQNPYIIQKRKKNNVNKYGVQSPSSLTIENTIKKYNEIGKHFNVDISFIQGKYNILCHNCNKLTITDNRNLVINRMKKYNITPCQECHPLHSSISGIEKEFKEFLEKIYDGEIIQSNRTILNGKEIDILLADINIGIEINGLYWHSDINKEDKNYHYNKTQLAKEKGIQLLHFFDDEIKQAMELIYSILSGKGYVKNNLDIEATNIIYGIKLNNNKKYFARKLIIESINNNNYYNKLEKIKYKNILKNHHIQGADNAKYYYGLKDKEGAILSIMSFKKMSADKNQIKNNGILTYELSRYVTIPGIQIIGGFSRLLKSFKREISNKFPNKKIELLTYSNLRYSKEEDNVYLRNGFNKIGFTGINYYYFFEGKKYHRFNFRKDNLYNKLLPERGIAVNPDYKQESERGMIQKLNDNGIEINKVYDCGNIKWIKSL